jgi:hypothetical protein
MRSGLGAGPPPGATAGAPAGDQLLRWREAATDPSALPARAADLADAAREVPALAPAALARIYANVTTGRRPARRHGVPLGLRLAMLAALILVSLATAKGAIVLWRRHVALPAPVAGAPRAKVAVDAQAGRRVEPSLVIQRRPIEQRAAPPPESPPARRPTARQRRAPAVEAAATESPPAVDPVNEAQLLSDAVRRLRQAHDPRGALALLDRYDETYPHGVLSAESRSARLEATLKLGDRAGALALLDARAGFTGRLGAEQLLTRAELRASVGRFADALADFDKVLAPSGGLGSLQADALERALYGRAVTLGHLGRDDRARAELQAYQRRFPAGKFAGEVARLLGRADAASGASGTPRSSP